MLWYKGHCGANTLQITPYKNTTFEIKGPLLDCCTEVYLEQVLGDDVEPLGVVSDSLQTLVGQNNLKHFKEEIQRILVQEVHLKQMIESILNTHVHKIK